MTTVPIVRGSLALISVCVGSTPLKEKKPRLFYYEVYSPQTTPPKSCTIQVLKEWPPRAHSAVAPEDCGREK